MTVKLYLYLQKALGWKELALDLPAGSTLAELIVELRASGRFPDQVKLGKHTFALYDGGELKNLVVLINGRHIKSLQGMSTKLEEEAEVALFPPAAGG